MIRARLLWTRCAPAVMAALCLAGAGNASGVNLSWNDCGSYGASNRNSLCSANNGANALVGSFVPPPGVSNLVAMEARLHVQVNSPVLPSWWQMGAGGCRATSLSALFAFQSLASCTDYWQGQAIGGTNYTDRDGGVNRALLRVVCAIRLDGGSPVESGTEYYAFQVLLNNANSDGCSGCLSSACIILDEIDLYQPGSDTPIKLTGPVSRSMVTWQGGECTGGVRNRTFGQIKSLYHH
jgi:hypothetical protein